MVILVAKQFLAPPPALFKKDPYALAWVNQLIKQSTDREQIDWNQIDFTDSDHDQLGGIEGLDPTSTDTERNKHVSNNDIKTIKDDISANASNIAANAADILTKQPIFGVQSVSTATNAVINTVYLVSGNTTITLPTPSQGEIIIKNTGTGTVTISGTVDGSTNNNLKAGDCANLYCDASGYYLT